MGFWKYVYNGSNEKPGEYREYLGQPGTFYQTYGNDGYWQREGVTAVWKVKGNKFKYLNNKSIEYQSQGANKNRLRIVRRA
jgi:hypothetical protein